MILKVEKEKCIGCGACVGISPGVYDFDDEGFAFVKVDKIEEKDEASAIDGKESCPTDAIYEEK